MEINMSNGKDKISEDILNMFQLEGEERESFSDKLKKIDLDILRDAVEYDSDESDHLFHNIDTLVNLDDRILDNWTNGSRYLFDSGLSKYAKRTYKYVKKEINIIIFDEDLELSEGGIEILNTPNHPSQMFIKVPQMHKLINYLENLRENIPAVGDEVIEELYRYYKNTGIFVAYGTLTNYILNKYTLSGKMMAILRPQLFVYQQQNHQQVQRLTNQENCFLEFNDDIVKSMIKENWDPADKEEEDEKQKEYLNGYYQNFLINLFYDGKDDEESRKNLSRIASTWDSFIPFYLDTPVIATSLEDAREEILRTYINEALK